MNKIKKGLGRGLSSLIGETKVETKTNRLSLSEIVPNRYQPRKNFDEENLEDLTNKLDLILDNELLEIEGVRNKEFISKYLSEESLINEFEKSLDVNTK